MDQKTTALVLDGLVEFVIQAPASQIEDLSNPEVTLDFLEATAEGHHFVNLIKNNVVLKTVRFDEPFYMALISKPTFIDVPEGLEVTPGWSYSDGVFNEPVLNG
jgi:hypothetical protein